MPSPVISIAKEDIPRELAALELMNGRALVARYVELYGESPRSKNRGWLVRRLAWRVQEIAIGGYEFFGLEKTK